MRDHELYRQILGIEKPWSVTKVDLDMAAREVVVFVDWVSKRKKKCPKCGKERPGYDTRRRRWRHLDTCQLKTLLEADVPRVDCPEHGKIQVNVPWSEPNSRFTALFECLVIDWLQETTITAVAVQLSLSWDQVAGVMERAVARGLKRRAQQAPRSIGVDETSFQKRHNYVTVVSDLEHGRVLHVAKGRTQAALDKFYESIGTSACAEIEVVAMDMWQAYITSTLRYVPGAKKKIAFDRFHVAAHLGKAVDAVRRKEHKDLWALGDGRLKGTKYDWLRSRATMSASKWRGSFRALRTSTLRTARAWSLKEMASTLWYYVSRGWAKRAWRKWLAWAARCRLKPMVRAARTIRSHLWGIINAIVHRATNASAESINAKIQKIKREAHGFRNRSRFKQAIYFHLGGLHLYPDSLTHTNS